MSERRTPAPRKTSPKRRKNKARTVVNAKAVEVTQRRERVAKLITAGVPYRRIAEQEGVSLGTIAQDKAVIMADWQACYVEVVNEQMLIDLRRADHVITHTLTQMQAEPNEPRHVANFVKILVYRMQALGYGAKDRREVPIVFPEQSPVIEATGEVCDVDGNPITDKQPAAAIFALLGGRRTGGTGGESGATESGD